MQADEGPQNWEWSSGKEAKETEPQEESLEERRRTAEAVTGGCYWAALILWLTPFIATSFEY